MQRWQDIKPEDAKNIDLSKDLTITAPLTMFGERCPWPWEPQQVAGPIGMFHCSYCGEMVMAGQPHTDYADIDWDAMNAEEDKYRAEHPFEDDIPDFGEDN